MARYPLATFATYGPDNTFATKLVVGIQTKPNGDVSEMRTWTTVGTDVRHAPVISEEVRRFVSEQRVKETVVTDRIIGCSHEEGIDYPMGRACPRCPFWAGRDRFTHEPIPAPQATLTPTEVLEDLSQEWTEPPLDALESADAHRDALIEPLLAALDRGIANPADASDEEGMLFSHALYLFAKWRDARAYPYVIRWLSLPAEGPFDIAGDIVTEHGPRILAAVCDGDLEPIRTLILNREANEYGRSAGIDALSLLAAWLEVPRQTVIDLVDWLAREGLEREPDHAWDSLADACRAIEAREMLPALRRAFDEDLIDEQYISRAEVEHIETLPPGETIRETRERFPPIEDVAEATAWWSSYADPSLVSDGTVPYHAPDKVGRNDPCPCGSGKKYKKCHGA